jgi:hypothetical protein
VPVVTVYCLHMLQIIGHVSHIWPYYDIAGVMLQKCLFQGLLTEIVKKNVALLLRIRACERTVQKYANVTVVMARYSADLWPCLVISNAE